MTPRTLYGPGGIRLVLDANEIYPDDPGNGTPAMVYCNQYPGTYWCALDTGAIGGGEYVLTDAQYRWLDHHFDLVSEFVDAHSGLNR